MSYGRHPHYIYPCSCDGNEELDHPNERHIVIDSQAVAYDAIAQLVTSMAARDDNELAELIQRGLQLRPGINPKLVLTVQNPGFLVDTEILK